MDYASELLGLTWVQPIRTERLSHVHILQSEDGIESCPACESIDPWHMTEQFFNQNYRKHEGGW